MRWRSNFRIFCFQTKLPRPHPESCLVGAQVYDGLPGGLGPVSLSFVKYMVSATLWISALRQMRLNVTAADVQTLTDVLPRGLSVRCREYFQDALCERFRNIFLYLKLPPLEIALARLRGRFALQEMEGDGLRVEGVYVGAKDMSPRYWQLWFFDAFHVLHPHSLTGCSNRNQYMDSYWSSLDFNRGAAHESV